VEVPVRGEVPEDAIRGIRQQLEAELGDDGRILIRPSGTEPLVRVMVEAAQQDDAERVAHTLAHAVRTAFEPTDAQVDEE